MQSLQVVVFLAALLPQVRGYRREDPGPDGECSGTGCSGHGRCVANACICDRGYSGSTCASVEAACPGFCSGHGHCDGDGCLCDVGYAGYDCGRALPHLCPLSCSGHGKCSQGQCECDPGFQGIGCDQIDIRNHGCPFMCSGRGTCLGGACRCREGFAGVACEHVAPPSCPFNCSGHGRCQTLSATGAKCICEAGWSGDSCSVFDGFRQGCAFNCSGHGICFNGSCLCDDGYVGEACALLQRLPGCLHGCSGLGECRISLLIAGPLPGVRRQPPPSQGLCVCVEGSGGADCGVAQAQAPSCPAACSGHGLCRTNGCACEAGFGGDDCAVVCPSRCSSHGHCTEDGTCICEAGWAGRTCAQPSACPRACSGRGECLLRAAHADEKAADALASAEEARRAAVAAATATTAVDEARAFATAAAAVAAALATAATAAAAPQCVCRRGWTGADCSEPDGRCPMSCAGHGRCVRGECRCDVGWRGPFCATSDLLARQAALQAQQPWRLSRAVPRCPNDCSGHGRACLNGTCVCAPGFGGVDCHAQVL